MLSKNHPMILFIDRFGFGVYQDTLANIPKFSFTPDLVSNLDIINKAQFVSLIGTFIQINKMVPSSLAVILSDDIIYIKDLAISQKVAPAQGSKIDPSNDKEHGDEIQNFLEDIPFEEVLAKVIRVGNINRVVAVNKDLVMAIADTFVSKGFTIEGIIPSFMYGQKANFTTGLTGNNVSVILEDTEILRSGNLLTNSEKIISSTSNLESELKSIPTNEVKKTKNFRQYILIGVFVILLIILAVVYWSMGASSTPPKSAKTKSASVNTVSAPTVPPVSQSTLTQAPITTVPVDLKSIKIKIVQSSQVNEKAINIKNSLLNIGLQDIVSEISEVSMPEKSSIIFSQSIPADLRNNIVAEIKKILPNISILEGQDINFTINIIIGKS